jgi:hypothetical protein
MSAHTPGEWGIGGQGWVIVDASGKWIADTRTVNRKVQEEHANARLIAAAPELLAALRWAHARFIAGQNLDLEDAPLVAELEAAIAKATGEQP